MMPIAGLAILLVGILNRAASAFPGFRIAHGR
jgi:hypothetical protein